MVSLESSRRSECIYFFLKCDIVMRFHLGKKSCFFLFQNLKLIDLSYFPLNVRSDICRSNFIFIFLDL